MRYCSMGKALQFCVHVLESVAYGSGTAVIGSSLPDIQCQMEVDERSIKLLLLLMAVGSISWTLFLPVSLKFFPPYFILGACSGITGLGFLVLPHVSNIYIAAAVVFMITGAVELAMSVHFQLILVTWPSDNSVFHVLTLITGVSYFLSVLVLSPFLSDGFITVYFKSIQAEPELHSDRIYTNTSAGLGEHGLVCRKDFTTMLVYPYILYSIAPLVCMFGSVDLLLKPTSYNLVQDDDSVDSDVLKGRLGVLYRLLTFLWFSSFMAITHIFSGLLPTFGISSILDLDRSRMALIVSVYYMLLIPGRLLATLASAYVKQRTILIVCVIGSNLTTIGLAGAPIGGEDLLWTVAVILGLFTGPLCGAAMLYCSQSIPPNQTMDSWYMISFSFALVHPYFCGILMAQFGPMTFLYYMSSLCFMTNMTLFCLHLFYNK